MLDYISIEGVKFLYRDIDNGPSYLVPCHLDLVTHSLSEYSGDRMKEDDLGRKGSRASRT